ncbi:MAG TPA: hypothetical protein VFG42_19595 [Baekduia sp.]|uniref:hypothetical protein n=1 Tax=Baekduia sp. TaxID=2600305 RepID=UPI002D79F783|nr:hypothetical protein [Baekduia sp.]HET6509007.1 hypothetical protein [Baekduia sp.]
MYGFALQQEGMERSVADDDPAALRIEGVVLDGAGEPLCYPDALVEVWHGDQFTRARTDPFGAWHVVVRKPADPGALPDGRTLAPYLHVTVWARGLMKQAETRLYFPDEQVANALDPVLALVEEGRRDLLVARRQDDGSLRFDIHLQGEREMVFFGF